MTLRMSQCGIGVSSLASPRFPIPSPRLGTRPIIWDLFILITFLTCMIKSLRISSQSKLIKLILMLFESNSLHNELIGNLLDRQKIARLRHQPVFRTVDSNFEFVRKRSQNMNDKIDL